MRYWAVRYGTWTAWVDGSSMGIGMRRGIDVHLRREGKINATAKVRDVAFSIREVSKKEYDDAIEEIKKKKEEKE